MLKKFFFPLSIVFLVNSSFAQPSKTPSNNDLGYIYQTIENNKKLNDLTNKLDNMFDFSKLTKNLMLPPSVVCQDITTEMKISAPNFGCATVEKSPQRSIYTNEKTKKLFTWRDVLVVNVTGESKLLQNNVDFESGRKKAMQEFNNNLMKLSKNYKGMLFCYNVQKNNIPNIPDCYIK
jgi:hypothetical protein